MNYKKTYDDFYNKHGAEVHNYPDRFTTIAGLCKGKVLDVGCGTAHLADAYDGDYTGIDVSSVGIKHATDARTKSAFFRVSDVTKPIDDFNEKFDTIVLAEFLEHVTEDSIIFANLKKWSHSKTRWVITVPNGDRVPDADHLREFTVPTMRKQFAQFGRVQFHNWSGFKNRICMTVDLGETNDNLIGVAMMVWNEGVGLERAILSCINFADEIHVSIDNKTDDNTEEVARRYADVVKFHEWKDDFSAARNSTHAGMTAKWLLYIDGHEYVTEYPEFRANLSDDFDGWMTKVVMENGVEFYYPRLYRNGVQFKNKIHNLVMTEKVKQLDGFTIVHDRYTGMSDEQRERRNKQRSKMMPVTFFWNLIKNPSDLRSRYYLARHHQDSKNFRKALRHYRLYLEKAKPNTESYQAAFQAHICALQLDDPKVALECLDICDQIAPLRWEIYKRRGMLYLALGNVSQAIVNLQASLIPSPYAQFDTPEPFLPAHTLNVLGQAYYQAKQFPLSIKAWEDALKIKQPDEVKQQIEKRIKFVREYHINKK